MLATFTQQGPWYPLVAAVSSMNPLPIRSSLPAPAHPVVHNYPRCCPPSTGGGGSCIAQLETTARRMFPHRDVDFEVCNRTSRTATDDVTCQTPNGALAPPRIVARA